jgi:hypothetical protein
MRLLLFILPSLILLSCGYRVTKSLDGQTLIEPEYFKFNQPMTSSDFNLVDTSAIYKKSFYMMNNAKFFPQKHDYNEYIKFYGNGTFLKIMKAKDFEPSDLNVDTKSVWKGRFVVSGNEIKMEEFYPQQAPTKTYEKKTLKGLIKNDTLVINWDEGNIKNIYLKQPLN